MMNTKLIKITPTQSIQFRQKQKQQTEKPSFEEYLFRALANGKEENMSKCNHKDCFTCPYKDCVVNDLTSEDRKEIRERDNRYYNVTTTSGSLVRQKPTRNKMRY